MATTQTLSSGSEAYATQAELTAAAVVAARRVEGRGPEAAAAAVVPYQLLAAQRAVDQVAAMLEEQGAVAPPVAPVAAGMLAGLAGNGLPLGEAFDLASDLARVAASAVQDAGRQGAGLAIASRPAVTGYVRMLNPPSCGRCAILAGKWFRWNQGFERHPNCDCRHIPVTEDSSDMRTNPQAYFDSLPTAAELEERYPDLTRAERRAQGLYSQEDIFTVAGAAAIRDGADISQVVNARRGMQKAQVFGREAWITTAATTRRGAFGRVNAQRVRDGKHKLPVRIMPETIYAIAEDRADAIRLLQLYGYLL